MRSGGAISAIRTAGLTTSAATEHLLNALGGGRPIAFVDGDRSAAAVESVHLTEATAETSVAVLTSGSTGTPKVVGLAAPSLVTSAVSSLVRLGADRGASWSLLLPVHHIAGIQILLRAAVNAGPVRGLDDGVDFTAIVPTQLQRALHGDQRLLEHLQHAKAVLVGGASLAAPLQADARERGITVVTTYGMSETAGGCIYDSEPLDGVEVRIMTDGRIAIQAPMLALGYLNDSAASAACFVDGWFHTSDLGSWSGGRLQVAGRADAVINSGGEKISLIAVETALREHPLIVDVIAAGAPDHTWGERLVVGVVASGRVSLEQLRQFVTERIDRVHAPRAVAFIKQVPTTALGKPDRPALLTHPMDEEV